MGDINSELASRRGRIQGTDVLPGDVAMIDALVPLAELTNDQAQLKGMTSGLGTFAMELSHFDVVPAQVQEKVIADYKQAANISD